MTAARLSMRSALRLAQPSRGSSMRTPAVGVNLPRTAQQTPYTATPSRVPRLSPLRARTISTLVSKPEHPEDESVLEGDPPLVHLTERAIAKIKAVAESDNDPKTALRIIVEPGGCHGYMYKLEITNKYDDDDFVFEDNGSRIVVDSFSLALVRGSTIDYVTELIGSQFAIKDNPQAKGSGCGCGVSWEPII
ncbi:ISA2 [Malassezia furfur]|nr:ISA2 [Malassezia furfur]